MRGETKKDAADRIPDLTPAFKWADSRVIGTIG